MGEQAPKKGDTVYWVSGELRKGVVVGAGRIYVSVEERINGYEWRTRLRSDRLSSTESGAWSLYVASLVGQILATETRLATLKRQWAHAEERHAASVACDSAQGEDSAVKAG